MRTKIAEVRLAPGQVGFYDDLTNIHLTLTKPYANVYQGMNTSGLQRSVNSRRLTLTWGSLRPAPVLSNEVLTATTPTPVAAPVKKAEEAKIEEVKVEEVKIEEVEVVEEAPVEEAPKTTKKKSTSKKKAEVAEEVEIKEEV